MHIILLFIDESSRTAIKLRLIVALASAIVSTFAFIVDYVLMTPLGLASNVEVEAITHPSSSVPPTQTYIDECPGAVWVTYNYTIKIRKDASCTSDTVVMAHADPGEVLECVGVKYSYGRLWYKVRKNGIVGFVSENLVEIVV